MKNKPQIENLILNNRRELCSLIGVYPDDIVCDGSYFQRQSSRHAGCQIDYMIQTKLGVIYLCEVKFRHNYVNTQVIDDVQRKIERLNIPKNMSIQPVLIHIGGVSDEVENAGYFTKIIDMSLLLESE